MSELLTTGDIARLMRVSVSTVRRIAGFPPPSQVTPGGLRRWESAVVQAYMDRAWSAPAAPPVSEASPPTRREVATTRERDGDRARIARWREEAVDAAIADVPCPIGGFSGAAGRPCAPHAATDGAARLKAARERSGLRRWDDVAAAAGVKSAGTVRTVASGAKPLTGALLAWVEGVERGAQ